jgi:hypothetical protein
MKFLISDPVRVTAVKNITSKAGNSLTFVTFANKSTFEVLECKLTLGEGQTAAAVVEGRDYLATVEYDGTYGSVMLTPAPVARPQAAATVPVAK